MPPPFSWTAPDPLNASVKTLSIYLIEIQGAINWHQNELGESTISWDEDAAVGKTFKKSTLDSMKSAIEDLADSYGYDGIDDPDLLGRDWTPYEYVRVGRTSRARWDYQLIQDMRQILDALEMQGFIETWDAIGYSGVIPTSISYSDSASGECVYTGPYPRRPSYRAGFASIAGEVSPMQGDYEWHGGEISATVRGSDYVYGAGDHEPRTNRGDVSVTFNKSLNISLTMQGGTHGVDGRGHGGSRRHSNSKAFMSQKYVVGATGIALPKNIQFSISGLNINATKEFYVMENGSLPPAINGMGEVYMLFKIYASVGGISILPDSPGWGNWYILREVHRKEDGGYGISLDIDTTNPAVVNYTLPAAGNYNITVKFVAEARADYGSGGANFYGTWNLRYNFSVSFDDIKIVGI